MKGSAPRYNLLILAFKILKLPVAPIGVMVKQHELSYSGSMGRVNGMLIVTMAPANLTRLVL
ncbi:MAG: hypothetical protein N2315_09520, partial [Thermanaerothrix sp.]|nr:hypothetical protein [Thermanaerothrix sp.]